MLKHAVAATAFVACFIAPADAQDAAPLPPVDTLTCEQMQGEMMLAGQQMNAQMDPNLATDIQAMQDTARERQRSAVAGQVGAGLMCAVPVLGMACMAAQQAQVNEQMSHAAEDQARTDQVIQSMNNSMAGIDQERMMAISNRFESQHCQTPQ